MRAIADDAIIDINIPNPIIAIPTQKIGLSTEPPSSPTKIPIRRKISPIVIKNPPNPIV